MGSGLINDEELKQGLKQQALWGKKLGESLVELGSINEEQLASVLGQITELPAVDLRRVQLNANATQSIPLEVCLKYGLVPVDIKTIQKKEQLVVAFSDPLSMEAVEELRFLTEHPVFRVVAAKSSVFACIEKQYGYVNAEKNRLENNEFKLDVQRLGGEKSQVKFESSKQKPEKQDAHDVSLEVEKVKKTITMLLKTLFSKQVLSKTELDLLENILE